VIIILNHNFHRYVIILFICLVYKKIQWKTCILKLNINIIILWLFMFPLCYGVIETYLDTTRFGRCVVKTRIKLFHRLLSFSILTKLVLSKTYWSKPDENDHFGFCQFRIGQNMFWPNSSGNGRIRSIAIAIKKQYFKMNTFRVYSLLPLNVSLYSTLVLQIKNT
jgi:hypothetical protein